MSEERRPYYPDQVLIEAARVIDRATPRAGPILTDAELDIIRNVLAYAHRRDTFVATYYPTYYEMPDDAEWDDIQEVVAELECKLMGPYNVIFGYDDRWFENLSGVVPGAGAFENDSDPVPAGYVYVLENVSMRNNTGARGVAQIRVYTGAQHTIEAWTASLLRYEPLIFNGSNVLKEGDFVRIQQDSCEEGDVIAAGLRGYMMKV
jgi:hypothetical protein